MTDLSAELQRSLAGSYTIERELGRGGMATVYLAQDLRHRRSVAIKVLRPELAAVMGADRFLREIELTARLTHPRILSIHDSGNAGGLLYYVMPFVDGESLRRRMDREGQLGVEDAVALTTAICTALEYAHGHGIVHRDIKPENVLLADGEVLVADFGIARSLTESGDEKLTQTGLAIGTPAYMSPEQAAGDREIDRRSDIFSLACVTFEMLVGEPPFRGPTVQAVSARRALEPMPSICMVRPGVPAAVECAVRKAMAKAPADRFGTARGYADAMAAGLVPLASPAVRRRSPRGVIGVVLALAALATAGTTVSRFTHRAARSGAGPAARPAQSLAVLAFRNLSGGAADSVLSRGLASEVATELKKVPGLRVAASAPVSTIPGVEVPFDSVARMLGVAQVVTGTLRRNAGGDSVRVEVQLIDAANGRRNWAGRFEAEGAVTFALQDSIVLAIVRSLQGHVGDQARRLVLNHGTTDLAAQQAYFRGRQILAGRQHLDEALRAFDDAIRRDSGYAKAWAGRGDAYAFMSFFCCMDPVDGLPLAKSAVLKALELDPTSAEAHTSLAIILQQGEKNDVLGRAHIDTALALDSTYAEAHLFLAWSHILRRETDLAIREARRAQQLSPRSAIISTRLGAMYAIAHDNAAAEAQWRRTLELDPGASLPHISLAASYATQRRCDMALRELAVTERPAPIERGIIGYTYARCGRRPEAARILRTLLDEGRAGHYVAAWAIARVYLGMGDTDRFFSWMERSLEAYEPFVPTDPVFYEVRGDPRFLALERHWILPAGTR